MRLQSLTAVLALSVFSSSAFASTILCGETVANALEADRDQYAVAIVEKGNMDSTEPLIYDGEVVPWDESLLVKVTVSSRNPRSDSSFERVMSFHANALKEDVSYTINRKGVLDSAARGFEFHLYLDELDQTTVKIPGVTGKILMNCHFKD
jgi:hypothetical protein